MTGATEGWAVGSNGTILRFDGAEWTSAVSPTTERLNAVFGTASDNVWAVGERGTVVRYDGAAWPSSTPISTRT